VHAPQSLAAQSLFAIAAAFYAAIAYTQEPPRGPEIVAKPAYLELVKAMRDDEVYALVHRARVELQKHPYNPRCIANLRPSQLTVTIAWALEPALSEQEAAAGKRFFETDVGRKWVARTIMQLEKKLDGDDPSLPQFSLLEKADIGRFASTSAGDKLLTRDVSKQKRVTLSVRGEVLELVNNCTQTLAGTRRAVYCESGRVSNAEKSCSANYSVAGPVPGDSRTTHVSYYCLPTDVHVSGTPLVLPGRHETVGLHWRENRVLEVLLPTGVKPTSQETKDYFGRLKIEYRARRPSDPPAMSCVNRPPLDEFGWPPS
jgi:hypothetical protein